MIDGHIKISRKTFDPLHGDQFWLEPRTFSRWEAWADLIQIAAFKARRYVTKYGVIDLARGEFVAAIRKLAERWQWHKNAVHNFLATLQKTGRIERRMQGRYGSLYLIVNYDAYQGDGFVSGTQDGTQGGTEAGRNRDKKEASKASKALKPSVPPYDSLFEESWAVYPKRPGNGKAEAWLQWLKRVAEGTDPIDMLTATRAYAKHVEAQGWQGADRRYVLMGRTFYGPAKRFADSWLVDEPSQPIVDEWGVLTAYGERVTRPPRVA